MIIDFKDIEETVFKNFRGGEKETSVRMFNDNINRIMQGKLEPGASIGLHTHEDNSEIIYIIKGCGKILYDNQYANIKAGICHYCPKGHAHSLINDSTDDLIFFAVVPKQ